jgi:hypothetical protein
VLVFQYWDNSPSETEIEPRLLPSTAFPIHNHSVIRCCLTNAECWSFFWALSPCGSGLWCRSLGGTCCLRNIGNTTHFHAVLAPKSWISINSEFSWKLKTSYFSAVNSVLLNIISAQWS